MKLDEDTVRRYVKQLSVKTVDELKQMYIEMFPVAIKCEAVSRLLEQKGVKKRVGG